MTFLEKLTKARQFAKKAHGTQKYDEKRHYIEHLDEVRNVALEFEILNEDILIATLLHDVLEDTNTTESELTDLFGEQVTKLVSAVSKIKGIPRSKQRDQYHQQILSTDGAITLKLCDRIANVRNCWLSLEKRHADGKNSSLLGMYKKEYGAFRKALRKEDDLQNKPMWDELDRSLNWKIN